nr:hypothetical protein [Desulfuromonas acetoxidans]
MTKCLLTLGVLWALCSPCWAVPPWEATVQLQSGVATNELIFGQWPMADPSLENSAAVPALLKGALQSCFMRKEHSLWRDIRALAVSSPVEWTVNIEHEKSLNQPLILRWKLDHVPEQVTLKLVTPQTSVPIIVAAGTSQRFELKKNMTFKIIAEIKE